ncbi:hypothetical protein LUZ60_006545 [Juncus effusus]|nr:hypothetical protein LUZ60_006545 [Juncus effusus]
MDLSKELTETSPSIELETSICECCGLIEECTPSYSAKIRETYGGQWICGLCGAAVKDETSRSVSPISIEEAVTRHINFCRAFRSASLSPPAGGEVLIAAVSQLLRRSLGGSPRGVRSSPTTPRKKGVGEGLMSSSGLVRTESCFPALT